MKCVLSHRLNMTSPFLFNIELLYFLNTFSPYVIYILVVNILIFFASGQV